MRLDFRRRFSFSSLFSVQLFFFPVSLLGYRGNWISKMCPWIITHPLPERPSPTSFFAWRYAIFEPPTFRTTPGFWRSARCPFSRVMTFSLGLKLLLNELNLSVVLLDGAMWTKVTPTDSLESFSLYRWSYSLRGFQEALLSSLQIISNPWMPFDVCLSFL